MLEHKMYSLPSSWIWDVYCWLLKLWLIVSSLHSPHSTGQLKEWLNSGKQFWCTGTLASSPDPLQLCFCSHILDPWTEWLKVHLVQRSSIWLRNGAGEGLGMRLQVYYHYNAWQEYDSALHGVLSIMALVRLREWIVQVFIVLINFWDSSCLLLNQPSSLFINIPMVILPCLSPEFLVTPRDKENQILKPTAHIQIPHCMISLLSNQGDWECTSIYMLSNLAWLSVSLFSLQGGSSTCTEGSFTCH